MPTPPAPAWPQLRAGWHRRHRLTELTTASTRAWPHQKPPPGSAPPPGQRQLCAARPQPGIKATRPARHRPTPKPPPRPTPAGPTIAELSPPKLGLASAATDPGRCRDQPPAQSGAPPPDQRQGQAGAEAVPRPTVLWPGQLGATPMPAPSPAPMPSPSAARDRGATVEADLRGWSVTIPAPTGSTDSGAKAELVGHRLLQTGDRVRRTQPRAGHLRGRRLQLLGHVSQAGVGQRRRWGSTNACAAFSSRNRSRMNCGTVFMSSASLCVFRRSDRSLIDHGMDDARSPNGAPPSGCGPYRVSIIPIRD